MQVHSQAGQLAAQEEASRGLRAEAAALERRGRAAEHALETTSTRF
jgi:hypothetical protein